MTHLEVKHVYKSFEDKPVIQDLSFSLQKGEFVSILGPSGSGKTTLFHLIGGIIVPDSGEIVLDGKNITGQKGHVSFMPQHPSLLPWRNLLDNVLLGQELTGKREVEKARNMLAAAGLEGHEKSYPHQLSGGMQQRASFLRALISPQSLMCLDEPFSALDEFTRLEMQKWLISIWEQYRRTVLFITHNIEEALFLSDRILIFSERPARMLADISVPFPRPRQSSLFLEREFFDWKRNIYEILRGEKTTGF